jgi:glucose-1-phosphate cytidylyltransferase
VAAVKVVILAGGLGTRLREETEFRPKPMVEVGGKPILWHLMKIFSVHDLTDFIVCTGYRGNTIKEYFLNYNALNNDFTIELGGRSELAVHGAHLESEWSVTVVDTGHDTPTGGRVKRVEPFVDDSPFIVTYGDGLADIDLTALVAFHRSHGRLATITAVQPVSRFGIIELGDADRVMSFREKPKSEDWVSAGFFVFDRRVFDYIAEDHVLELDPLESLAKEGELVAYRHTGFWQPMDTYRELLLLESLWQSTAPWKTWA